jgi:hypothetical protein
LLYISKAVIVTFSMLSFCAPSRHIKLSEHSGKRQRVPCFQNQQHLG